MVIFFPPHRLSHTNQILDTSSLPMAEEELKVGSETEGN